MTAPPSPRERCPHRCLAGLATLPIPYALPLSKVYLLNMSDSNPPRTATALPPIDQAPAVEAPSSGPLPLLGMELSNFETLAKESGLPPFAARQIAKWVYEKRIFDPEAMTDLPKRGRERLAALVVSGAHAPVKATTSRDGTKKYLFATEVGRIPPNAPRLAPPPAAATATTTPNSAPPPAAATFAPPSATASAPPPASTSAPPSSTAQTRFIEAAYIPDRDRATLCVSSQVGCKMGCLFCSTGRMGFHGQLSVQEILNQIVSIPKSASLTNVVYMGMGEPFDNLDNVLATLRVLCAPWGFAWSPRRITVSTVGVLPGLRRFLDESECHLAVSLHSPFHDERRALMPVEAAYALPELIGMIRSFDFGRQRRISFEYILFEGLNDSSRHINEIARLLNGVNCRFNLIAFHAIPDVPFRPASRQRLEWFRDELGRKGFTATIRASRGEDILAACGLLSTRELSSRQEAGQI